MSTVLKRKTSTINKGSTSTINKGSNTNLSESKVAKLNRLVSVTDGKIEANDVIDALQKTADLEQTHKYWKTYKLILVVCIALSLILNAVFAGVVLHNTRDKEISTDKIKHGRIYKAVDDSKQNPIMKDLNIVQPVSTGRAYYEIYGKELFALTPQMLSNMQYVKHSYTFKVNGVFDTTFKVNGVSKYKSEQEGSGIIVWVKPQLLGPRNEVQSINDDESILLKAFLLRPYNSIYATFPVYNKANLTNLMEREINCEGEINDCNIHFLKFSMESTNSE